MKKVLFPLLLLTGCIQTDLEDPFTPTLRIENSVDEIDFRVNGSYPLSAVYTDDTGEPFETALNWQSSDESILSFLENTATVHAEGIVLIRVTANGLEASTLVETLPSRGSLQISGFTPKLQSGNATAFKFNFIDLQGATNNDIMPVWSSSNESIATVDQNGVVAAVASGLADISVSFDGITNSVKLEVSNDPVMLDPVIRMVKFAEFLSAGEVFQFQTDYYNEHGLTDNATLPVFSSSDPSILSVDDAGLVTAQLAGTATIVAEKNNVSTSIQVEVEGGEVMQRTGTLSGTGYDIEGNFTLQVNEEGDLILTVLGYKPDGPGPYFYLTNQDSNVNNGLSLGEAETPGDIVINVSSIDSSVELSTFNYLMVWCEPFRVRLGVGAFNN